MKTFSDVRFAEAAKPLSQINPPQFFKAHAENPVLTTSGANALTDAFASIYRRSEALAKRRTAVDPTITEAANMLAVGKLTDDLVDSTNKSLKVARDGVDASLSEAKVKLIHKAGLKPMPNATELRAALLKLPSGKRDAAIREAFVKHDEAVISAITIDAHPMLHGANMETIGMLSDKYRQEVAPEEYYQVKQHEKLLARLDQAEVIALKFQREAYSGMPHKLSDLRRTESLLKSYDKEIYA